MDKKSLIGLGLSGGILFLWLWLSGPTKEQIARNKQIQDSGMQAETKKAEEAAKLAAIEKAKVDTLVKVLSDTAKAVVLSDSAKAVQQNSVLQNTFKDFAVSAKGTDENFTIENELIKATISAKGGRVTSVELKKYFQADRKTPVMLFDADSSRQALRFFNGDKPIYTDQLYFTPATTYI